MAQRRTQPLHAMEQAQRWQARSLLVLHPDHNNSLAGIFHNRLMQKSMAIFPPRSLDIDHIWFIFEFRQCQIRACNCCRLL
jgi:hypothetical protein